MVMGGSSVAGGSGGPGSRGEDAWESMSMGLNAGNGNEATPRLCLV